MEPLHGRYYHFVTGHSLLSRQPLFCVKVPGVLASRPVSVQLTLEDFPNIDSVGHASRWLVENIDADSLNSTPPDHGSLLMQLLFLYRAFLQGRDTLWQFVPQMIPGLKPENVDAGKLTLYNRLKSVQRALQCSLVALLCDERFSAVNAVDRRGFNLIHFVVDAEVFMEEEALGREWSTPRSLWRRRRWVRWFVDGDFGEDLFCRRVLDYVCITTCCQAPM